MINMSKTIISVVASEEALTEFDKSQAYHNATAEERRAMADAE